MYKTLKNISKEVFWFSTVILISIFILPFLIIRFEWGYDLGVKEPDKIATIISGILSPFLGYLSAILIFLTFSEQRKANTELKLQNEELRSEKNDNVKMEKMRLKVREIRNNIKSITVKYKMNDMETVKSTSGKDAFYVFYTNFFYGIPVIVEGEYLLYGETIKNIYDLLAQFNLSKIGIGHYKTEFSLELSEFLNILQFENYKSLSDFEYNRSSNSIYISKYYNLIESQLALFNC